MFTSRLQLLATTILLTALFAAPPAFAQKAANPSPVDGAADIDPTVHFSWTGPSEAIGYFLQYWNANGGEVFTIYTKQTSYDTSGSDTIFYDGDYKWRIDVELSNTIITGDIWQFSTLRPPTATALLSPAYNAVGVQLTTVLSWAPADHADTYLLNVGTSPENLEQIVETDGTSHMMLALARGTTYYWRVDSKNLAGVTPGPSWSFTTHNNQSILDIGEALSGKGTTIPVHNPDGESELESPYEYQSIAAPGDLNGDGFEDLVVGYPSKYPDQIELSPTVSYSGELAAHFGRSVWPSQLSSTPPPAEGFATRGIGSFGTFGTRVASIGDLNGDGLYDFAMPFSNKVALIKGTNEYPNISETGLDDLILAMMHFDVVASAGNIDGVDALDVIGYRDSYTAERPGTKPFSNLEVLFGNYEHFQGPFANWISLDKLITNTTSLGHTRGANDLNGDGISDLLINPPVDANAPARIIFGSFVFRSKSWQLDNLNGTDGFKISIADVTGAAVDLASIGDFNGDGYADILYIRPDHAYIILGRKNFAATIDPAADALTISITPGTSTFLPYAMAIGDINGDARSDLALSTTDGDAYIIHGNATFPSPYDVDTLTAGPLVHSPWDFMRLMHAGDVNGDGVGDFIVIAYEDLPNRARELDWVRMTSVFFGQAAESPMQARAIASAGNSRQTGIGESNPENPIPLTRLWMNFEDGSAPDGGPSTIDVTVYRNADDPVTELPTTPNATVAWKVETNRENWTHASMTFRYHDADIAGIDMQKLRAYIAPAADGPWRIAEVQVPMPHIHMIRLQIGGADFANGTAWVTLGTEGIELGDVNMDGEVDTADIIAARQVIAGERAHPESLRAADLVPHGGDGAVTEDDLLAIIELITGK